MKTKLLVSLIYIISMTILVLIGFCTWDLWIYLFGLGLLIIFVCIFSKQERKYDQLTQRVQKRK